MEHVVREVSTTAEADTFDPTPPQHRHHLSEVERSVVRLSRRDPRSSLDDGRSWRRSAARLLGARPHNALADPDLETLRRYAVSVRLRREGRCRDGELPEIRMASAKAAEVERLVASWNNNRSNDLQWMGTVVLGVLAASAYFAVADSLGDRLVALMVVGLLVIVAAPILLPDDRR